MDNLRLRLLSYVVIIYMLMAFAWWSVLLWTTIQDAFLAKRDLLRIGMVAEGLVRTDPDFFQSPRYLELAQSYTRQRWMVVGEGVFFVISIVIGIWLINRGYQKEALAAQQRRNFLLSITHELKSPIASLQLLMETFQKRSLQPDQIQRLTGSGLRESERLNNLVNDLLLSAKLDTAYQPNLVHLDLDELLSELLDKMREKHPEVHFSYQVMAPSATILADKMGMTSVALNLLENAVKYTPNDPHIEVRLSQKEDWVQLDFADNGPGIPDKEKKRIFEKFYRMGNEDTRKTKGTGLGLFIVKEIVRAHAGKIMVLDNEPHGTVFRILLRAGL